jgi:hypothetical protein
LKVEDFTHVLPEDKPIYRKRNKILFDRIYDLAEANALAKHYEQLRNCIAEIEAQARLKYSQLKPD